MDLHKNSSEIYVPDDLPESEAIARTSHIAIGAHHDDIEIMAYHGIAECFGRADRGFMGVVVTDGAGSPRSGIYASYSDEQMREVRRIEQKKAAAMGEYCALALLDYSSAEVKDPSNPNVISDIENLLKAALPEIVYTHNLADKHDTHVAVALRVIQAIRQLPIELRPKHIYGCEVWRGLDWLIDEDKVVLDVSAHENLAEALLGVFDSQICGGKRYDLATIGRQRANATYLASHDTDTSTAVTFAMDLTPLIQDDLLDIGEYVKGFINRFAEVVAGRVIQV
ncbi:MAG: PIG-L family deacetylase [Armatimonadetes bacterium]|nr:PIG-L family deacetylase [Armatimonadota bacterium]